MASIARIINGQTIEVVSTTIDIKGDPQTSTKSYPLEETDGVLEKRPTGDVFTIYHTDGNDARKKVVIVVDDDPALATSDRGTAFGAANASAARALYVSGNTAVSSTGAGGNISVGSVTLDASKGAGVVDTNTLRVVQATTTQNTDGGIDKTVQAIPVGDRLISLSVVNDTADVLWVQFFNKTAPVASDVPLKGQLWPLPSYSDRDWDYSNRGGKLIAAASAVAVSSTRATYTPPASAIGISITMDTGA